MKYLDQDGLLYVKQKIVAGFVQKENGKGLSTNDYTTAEKTKLAGLENYSLPTASSEIKGGIKVGAGLVMNGEVLSATGGGTADAVEWANVLNKPTKLSDFTNDGDGTAGSAFATEDYVDENGGKIDSIKVNGTTQTITNKVVDITVPTNNNQLTNGAGYITGIDSTDVTTALGFTPYNATNPNGYITGIDSTDVTTALGFTPYNATNPNSYQTSTEVQTAINNALADVTSIDFEVVSTLPSAGVKGTIYLVSNSGSGTNIYDEYIWVTNGFEKIGTTEVDLSNYYTKSQQVAITNAEIDTIFA